MQIEKLGWRTGDVSHIVLTHLDFDHAGGLDDFPNATVHLLQQERDDAAGAAQLARPPALPAAAVVGPLALAGARRRQRRRALVRLRLMEKHRRSRLANQQRLRELRRQHGAEVEVLCAHDPVEFERVAGRPMGTTA